MDILLRTLLSRPWLIEQSAANTFLPMVANLLKGQSVSVEDSVIKKNQDTYAPKVAVLAGSHFQMMEAGDLGVSESGVLVIKHEGVLMKQTVCGMPGTAQHMATLKAAAEDDRIVATVIEMDTPGGSTVNLQEFATAVATHPKPVFFLSPGMLCSAGMFASAGSDGIYATSQLCEFGSIGVQTTIYDYREEMAQMGVKEHIISARTSPLKNKSYKDARDGDYTLLQEEQLDPMDAVFMAHMKGHRGISDQYMEGSVYLTDAAIAAGLCDGITTLEELIDHAYDMGVKREKRESLTNA